jgi:tetratricopeptide (TPR) repeat protein
LEIGLLKKKLENLPRSLKYFEEAIIKFIINDDYQNLSVAYLEIAEIYFKEKLYDKAMYFCGLVLYRY